ncbi:MAG: thioredoxin family protein [Chloroflexi bacterium]|nr:thioredoxin family protein [Chloroflexota bacterium]
MKQNGALRPTTRLRNARLEVFVSDRCWQCPEARAIAQDIQKKFPALDLRIVNLDAPHASKPEIVFSVPTFLLNGTIVSLGTPSRATLSRKIRVALGAREMKANERVKDRLSPLE